MTNKDRAERLIEELDLVSADLLREIRALSQNVSKAMDLRFGDMAAYAEDIIAQIIR
ncbi:hypothetical protein ApAK_03860 [Thermoplasmatales archaeon AK]|nr:hypothetical protein [Thermoplasmatales archaeon AK]